MQFKKKDKILFLLVLTLLPFVSADLISIGTGGDEIVIGYGNQIDLFFSGVESNPVIIKLSPESSIATETLTQTYIYNVSDNEDITNCSLLMNNVVVGTDTSINKTENNSFIYTQAIGTFNWSIQCIDLFGNTGTTENFTIRFYIDAGGGGGTPYTYYSECYNITDNECRYTAFYDQPCPEDYFLTLEYCNEALITAEINRTTLDQLIDWANTMFTENRTSFPLDETDIKNIINKIPSDLNRYFSYLALKITPSNEARGKCIIIIFLILLVFSKKIYKMIRESKVKDKW